MTIELTPHEARVIGCLLEKEVTTPEHYPLTLNSLTLAVNQKSNRDPLYCLCEAQIMDTLELLKTKHLISPLEGAGSRVTKYQHRFCNTEFGSLQLHEKQRGILCVLMLRGPQMPGELRTRTQRLCQFTDMTDLDSVLKNMIEEGYIAQLPREAGKREGRYIHLFSSETALIENRALCVEDKDVELSLRVETLECELAQLKERVDQLINDKT